MSREQRWAASGVVVLIGALWGAVGASAVVDVYSGPQGDDMTGFYVFAIGALILGFSLLWLLAGLVTVRRVAAGVWPWRPVAMLSGLAAVMSALTVPATWSGGDRVALGALRVPGRRPRRVRRAAVGAACAHPLESPGS